MTSARALVRIAAAFVLAVPLWQPGAMCARAASVGDDAVVQARAAYGARNRVRLAALKSATADHPLAGWVDYWELTNRLSDATVQEVEDFYARRRGSYVEDRLRNDWLLELGRRRDWNSLARDYPRFVMDDDRQVTCYWLLTEHFAGTDVRVAARNAWFAQKDPDDACQLLASTLYTASRLSDADVWQKVHRSIDARRPQAALAAAKLMGPDAERAVSEIVNDPIRFLTREARRGESPDLGLLALMHAAYQDPEAAAKKLEAGWNGRLGPGLASQAWATAGRAAAFRQLPQALDYYRSAWRQVKPGLDPGWSDETLAWSVRAALRGSGKDSGRWSMIRRAVAAMSPAERQDPAWTYWDARAAEALAPEGEAGDAERAAARSLFAAVAAQAGQTSFYGQLAAEELGPPQPLPEPPPAPTADERAAVRAVPGFDRALQLIALGLRSEGVREWNYTLRARPDRELLAAAEWACEREVWDRCINTSERTREVVYIAQRYPTPFRAQVLARAQEAGLDPAYVYGLIRQESRFIADARSGVGAAGLMQIMPATAQWTAKKIGLDLRPDSIADRDTNLALGTRYLRLVLDDFGGSQAMAAAAYNAGPNRPRKWREGGSFEPAAWTEAIPFNETRDYVKKVLANAAVYAALFGSAQQSAPAIALRPRLGAAIGPAAAAVNRDLP